MDILKARKKAQEAKEAKEREAAAAAAAAAAKETAKGQSAPPSEATEPKRKRARHSQPPQPAQSTPPQRAIDAELEAARDRAIVGDDDDDDMTQDFPRESTREIPREAPVRLDPLHEFLAVYDEGDLAHVVDFGATSQAADDEKRFLSFDLAGEAYAASIMDIREILKFVSLTEVPRAPREVLGVLSKRGIVMPVVDLGAILGLRPPDKRIDRDQRVLVAGDGERVCGLRVDRVHEVVRLAQRAIEDVPPSLGAKNAHMLIGLGRVTVDIRGAASRTRMLILLDVPAVLAHFSESMGIAAAGGAYGEGAT
jgi:purine-binding chemotaxis protein CheW